MIERIRKTCKKNWENKTNDKKEKHIKKSLMWYKNLTENEVEKFKIKIKEGIKNMPKEKRKQHLENVRQALKETWKNKTQKELDEIAKKQREIQKKIWKNKSDEEKQLYSQAQSILLKSIYARNGNDILKKIRDTKYKNCTLGNCSSRIELHIYNILCKIFGSNNITHHKKINKWTVDMYIIPHDIYLQIDGVYWHGLDRSLREIKEFKTLRDKAIYGTYIRDIEQNKWFKENNLILSRITDVQAEQFCVSNLVENIYDNIINI